MPSLGRLNERFETTFHLGPNRLFKGVLLPADEGAIPSYDFVYPRLTFRVRANELAKTGDVFTDPWNRHFLMGDHDLGLQGESKLYRTHRCFQLNHQVSWKRTATTTDTLTGLKKSGSDVEMGPIWVALELYGRETPDSGLRVAEETRRLITGSPIALNDKIDGAVVKRLVPIYGVWLAEIQ